MLHAYKISRGAKPRTEVTQQCDDWCVGAFLNL